MKVATDHTICRYGSLWNTKPACPYFACLDPDGCTTCRTNWLDDPSEKEKLEAEEAEELEKLLLAEEERLELLHNQRVKAAKPAIGYWLGST